MPSVSFALLLEGSSISRVKGQVVAISMAALGVALTPPRAWAAEPLIAPEVTIYGTRAPLAPQPQAVTIIDQEEIARSGASTLADLLEREAFVVKRYGGAGAVAGVTMRGVGSQGVLILRDGVRLNDPQNGGVDLVNVSLVGIERVEVLEGGSSSAYGPDAVGGVINLVSAIRPGTRVELGAGSWGAGHLQMDVGQVAEDTEMAVGVRRDFAQNDYPYIYRDEVQARRNAGLEATDLSIRLKRFMANQVVDGTIAYAALGKGVPGPINFPSARATQRDEGLQGSLAWRLVSPGGISPGLSLSHRHSVVDYLDLDNSFGPPRTQNAVESTALLGKLLGAVASNDVEVGAEVARDALDNTGFGFRQRWMGSAFAHDTLHVAPGLQLFADGRMDASSLSGTGFSPRLGGAWKFWDRHRVRASAGQSYRAPTFNDLYWPTSKDAAGNPDLRPETTRTVEAGFDSAPLDALLLQATGFLNLGQDTIVWQPGAAGRWMPVNLGATDTRGLEGKVSYKPFEGLKLEGSHAILAAIDLATTGATAGKTLVFRPDRASSAAVRLGPWAGLGLGVTWIFVGERFTTASNTEKLDPYDLLSLDLEWRPTASDTARFHVENVLNTFYILQPQYPMPGRALWANWAHTF